MPILSSLALFLVLSVPRSAFAETAPRFPAGFKWCTATSAHQIEGMNQHSDWWQWEQGVGRVRHGERSGRAADHWNRWIDDVGLMRELGVNTYRMSVEWARLEPRRGEIDWAVVSRYRAEIDLLRASGIEPIITLHHFTFPQWIRDLGGWEWEGIFEAFSEFGVLVYSAIAPDVRDWITINEPMVHLVAGYLVGMSPPGLSDIGATRAPLVGMLKAHARVYHALHASAARASKPLRVGLAHHLRVMDPYRRLNPLDAAAAAVADQVFNWAFPVAVETGVLEVRIPFGPSFSEFIPTLAGTQDFIGVNYYSRDLIVFSARGFTRGSFKVKAGAPVSDMNWEIYPRGLYRVLVELAKRIPGKPVVITENGLADAADTRRRAFIRDHLFYLGRAMAAGVNVEGYCHWSLLDNFEWSDGFEPRFGLYEVDYDNGFKRTLRASGQYYSERVRASTARARARAGE